MFWLVKGKESYQINAYNLIKDGEKYQLWVSCTNGKNRKMYESEVAEEVKEIKEMIDYAVKSGATSVEI